MPRWRSATTVVGVDVQAVGEVESSLEEFGDRYAQRIFTEHELASCQGDSHRRASGLAARFAAKEAVLKVLDITDVAPPWKTIEVHRGDGGRPEIVLHGEASDLARHHGVRDIVVSLSHSGGVAAAAVVARSVRPRRKRAR